MQGDVDEKLTEIQDVFRNMTEVMTESLKKIERNIEEIINALKVEAAKKEAQTFKPSLLLDFPDHLRVTIRALLELGVATAEEVSTKTGRSRSLESTYLNSLTTMGYVEKERKRQQMYYKIKFNQAIKVVGE